MPSKKRIYRVRFINQDQVYEIYARGIGQPALMGFVEVQEPVFGERTAVLVDPVEERLKNEFAGVSSFYLPINAVIRIDEVEREGVAKISELSEGAAKVHTLPLPPMRPGDK